MAEPSVPNLTVEELARQFEVPVSTIRMYQHRGLLPPPERRGRVGFYGDEHVGRMRMLGTLQERGYSLAAIKDLLDGWQQGQSLDDVLGLTAGQGVFAADEPVVLDLGEVAIRFPAEAMTPEVMRRAEEVGVIRLLDDGRVEITSPRFLEIGTRLIALGIPAAEVIEEFAVLDEAMGAVAGRFTDLFRRHIWAALVESTGTAAAPPPDAVDQVRRSLDDLGPLATAVVELALRRALQAEAKAFLDEQVAALAGTARPVPAKARSSTKATKRAPAKKAPARRR